MACVAWMESGNVESGPDEGALADRWSRRKDCGAGGSPRENPVRCLDDSNGPCGDRWYAAAGGSKSEGPSEGPSEGLSEDRW